MSSQSSVYRQNSLALGRRNITSKTAAYTATVNDDIILVDATSGSVTITLPAVTNTNKSLTIKKTDSTQNHVIVDTPSTETIDGIAQAVLVKQYEVIEIASNGTNWFAVNRDLQQTRLLSKTTVLLTATAVTPLITVPTGYTLNITDIQYAGVVVQSGGTASTLKIGTSGGSYAELLNGSTGLVQTTATATTLVQANDRFSVTDRFTIGGNQAAPTRVYAAGTVIGAQVTGGGLPSAGTASIEIYGYFV